MPNGVLWRNLSSPRRCHRFTLLKKACRSAGPVLLFHTRGPELAEVPKCILCRVHNSHVRLGILQLDVSCHIIMPHQHANPDPTAQSGLILLESAYRRSFVDHFNLVNFLVLNVDCFIHSLLPSSELLPSTWIVSTKTM